MSLILDALKKSEAERQLGRAPGLMSPVLRVPKRRGPSPWWGVLGLAVAVAAGAVWWMRQQSVPAPMPPTQSATMPATDTADPSSTPMTSAPQGEAAPSPPPPVATATTPALAQDATSPESGDVAAMLPRDPEFDSIERESMPVAPQSVPTMAAPEATGSSAKPRATAPVVTTASASTQEATTSASAAPALPQTPPAATTAPRPASAASAPLQATTPTPVAAPPPQAPTSATIAPPLPQATTPGLVAPPAPAEPPPEPLPLVTELLPDMRSALPTLKLSMHVYVAAPAGRFVLIDGRRHAQGDRVAPSLTVSEIRRDGVVLDFDGTRFLVPRP